MGGGGGGGGGGHAVVKFGEFPIITLPIINETTTNLPLQKLIFS